MMYVEILVANAALSRLTANVGGATASKRKLHMSTVQSILPYASEMWPDSLSAEYRRKALGAVQRHMTDSRLPMGELRRQTNE